MNFFTSDLHYGSDDTVKFDNRPFRNAKHFAKQTIKNFNKIMTKKDTLYVIGDFADCHSQTDRKCIEVLSLVKKIKAKVVLILGNNEERIIKYFFDGDFDKFKDYCLSIGFASVKENDTINICNTTFFLTHKPKHHNGEMLNLFGHSHKALGLYKPFGFNIGCDLNNYRPYSEKDIQILLDKKEKYWDKDENLK